MTEQPSSIRSTGQDSHPAAKTYRVFKTPHPIPVNGDVEKPVWQQTAALEIACAQPKTGSHCPRTHVKVRYDDDFVYVLFQTADQFVRAVAMDTHGEVWKDSCVEFFFTPQCDLSKGYFNLEINCIGTLLMRYQAAPNDRIRYVDKNDCGQIRVAASMAHREIPSEIQTPVVWTVECALPVAILRHYAAVEQPRPGVVWRANFNKCADDCSRPHWLSWSPVLTAFPDFHRPDCFGRLEFQ
jgi:hypothetical protein